MSVSGIGNNNMGQFASFMQGGGAEPAPQQPEQPEQPEVQATPVEAEQPTPPPAPEQKPEPEPAVAKEEAPEAKPDQAPAPEPQIDDDVILAYFRDKKGKELESLDDLFKTAEPPAPADPYEGMAEDVVAFLKYHKDTGRGFNDYVELNKDINAMSPVDIAVDRAMSEIGGGVTREDAVAYLEKKLGVDMSSPEEMDKADLMELRVYGNPHREKLIEQQQKYRMPVSAAQGRENQDLVRLDDGTVMQREEYENLRSQRELYLENIRKTADSITGSNFKVKVDNNGEEKVYELGYEYSTEDKHNMVSASADIRSTFSQLFESQKGFDYAGLEEAMWWANPNNRAKAINSIVHKALAERTQEFMEITNNTGVKTGKIPKPDGAKPVAVTAGSGYGVKWNLEHFKPPQN